MDLRAECPATVRQVADHLMVTTKTVRRWMSSGLEHVQVGGRILTTWEAVGRFSVDRNRVDASVSHPSQEISSCLKKHSTRY